MGEANTRASEVRLTPSERWAAWAAQHASGVIGTLLALAIAVALLALSAFRDALLLWGLGVVMLLVALAYWERSGFKRLLARRDEEIEQLRSGERSA